MPWIVGNKMVYNYLDEFFQFSAKIFVLKFAINVEEKSRRSAHSTLDHALVMYAPLASLLDQLFASFL